MRYPAELTAQRHEQILDAAATLFRERGFASVTVGEVMRAAGLTHGAFYAHFASKDDLVAAAVERALKESAGAVGIGTGGTSDARASYVDAYLSRAHRDAQGSGCAIAALGAEITRSPAAKSIVSRRLERGIEKMAKAFPWRRKAEPRTLAIATLSATVGALVLSRLVDDPILADEILDETRNFLHSSS
jgi:TetR/AcrR family transcriptional repressor of nem operon